MPQGRAWGWHACCRAQATHAAGQNAQVAAQLSAPDMRWMVPFAGPGASHRAHGVEVRIQCAFSGHPAADLLHGVLPCYACMAAAPPSAQGFPLCSRRCRRRGCSISVPRDVEGTLVRRYGPGWRTPRQAGRGGGMGTGWCDHASRMHGVALQLVPVLLAPLASNPTCIHCPVQVPGKGSRHGGGQQAVRQAAARAGPPGHPPVMARRHPASSTAATAKQRTITGQLCRMRGSRHLAAGIWQV